MKGDENMTLRMIFVLAAFWVLGIPVFAQPSSDEALAGLKKYAAAMDAVESATFYYQRTIFSPAMNEKEAVINAIQMTNRIYQQVPSSGVRISTDSFVDQINQQKDNLMKEYRQVYIHQLGFAKDFQSDVQFYPNGQMIFGRTIDGTTVTTVNHINLGMSVQGMSGQENTVVNSETLKPDQKWLTDLLRWRRALELIASATSSVSAIDGGQFLLKIETYSVYGDQTVKEIYELELQKQRDFYVPVVYRTIFESSTQNLMYENYVFRKGLPLPSSIRQENVQSKREMIIFRLYELSYALLPEGYKLGDALK
jgi:hypothetical protein